MKSNLGVNPHLPAGRSFRLTVPPAGHEIATLRSNLNYDPRLGKATVSADLDGTLMRVSELERERLLYFRKAAK
jgi:hypothetical protein